MPFDLFVEEKHYPIAGEFRLSRGAKTQASCLRVTLVADGKSGHAECVPYPRYGETLSGVKADLERVAPVLAQQNFLPAQISQVYCKLASFSGKNAFECAFLDWEAKKTGFSVAEKMLHKALLPLTTAFTLSLASPDEMEKKAREHAHRPLLKLKLGAQEGGDEERLLAVRQGAPLARLIVDANEGWSPKNCLKLCELCAQVGVELIEQPLPEAHDELLRERSGPVLICADESLHGTTDPEDLRDRYDALNLKLDKTGGITSALLMARQARDMGFKIMVGCMLGSSLAMAPAFLVAQLADYVDLDGPLLLAQDCKNPIIFDKSLLFPPSRTLWG